MYDMIIVGAGPAGLTAALYARRADKTVLILEKETFGGQITYSPKVENYPGSLQMSGNEFAERLVEQVLAQGAEIELDRVTGIRVGGTSKTVMTENGSYEARAVILATGSRHRQLGLPRENDLIGEGISYCAVCDGAFYAGRSVAVIGGGNTALQDAMLLADRCARVTVVQNLSDLTGEKRLADALRARDNVEFIFDTVVQELVGDTALTALKLHSTATGEERMLPVDGAFVAIGQQPENDPFRNVCALNSYGYVDAGESCLTQTPGVFAAGDCRSKQVRQITTATADGAVAALAACRYLDDMN